MMYSLNRIHTRRTSKYRELIPPSRQLCKQSSSPYCTICQGKEMKKKCNIEQLQHLHNDIKINSVIVCKSACCSEAILNILMKLFYHPFILECVTWKKDFLMRYHLKALNNIRPGFASFKYYINSYMHNS